MRNFNLYAFTKIVDCGTVSAAAAELSMTQSGASMLLHRLAGQYGVELVRRHHGALQPTAAGQALYEYAKEVLRAEQRLERGLERARERENGWVRIGATHTVATHFLPPALTIFREGYPEARVSVEATTVDTVRRLLLDDVLDFAYMLRQDDDSLMNTPVHRERVIVVASPDDPLANQPRVGPREVASRPFVFLGRYSHLRDQLEYALGGVGRAWLQVALEVTDDRAQRSAVKEGIGLGLMFEAIAHADLEAGSLREVTVDGVALAEDFCLIRRKNAVLTAAATALYATILHAARPDAASTVDW